MDANRSLMTMDLIIERPNERYGSSDLALPGLNTCSADLTDMNNDFKKHDYLKYHNRIFGDTNYQASSWLQDDL